MSEAVKRKFSERFRQPSWAGLFQSAAAMSACLVAVSAVEHLAGGSANVEEHLYMALGFWLLPAWHAVIRCLDP